MSSSREEMIWKVRESIDSFDQALQMHEAVKDLAESTKRELQATSSSSMAVEFADAAITEAEVLIGIMQNAKQVAEALVERLEAEGN